MWIKFPLLCIILIGTFNYQFSVGFKPFRKFFISKIHEPEEIIVSLNVIAIIFSSWICRTFITKKIWRIINNSIKLIIEFQILYIGHNFLPIIHSIRKYYFSIFF